MHDITQMEEQDRLWLNSHQPPYVHVCPFNEMLIDSVTLRFTHPSAHMLVMPLTSFLFIIIITYHLQSAEAPFVTPIAISFLMYKSIVVPKFYVTNSFYTSWTLLSCKST